jgi:hypothetical protein
MGAASALGRDASILSPLSQAFEADEQRQPPLGSSRVLLTRKSSTQAAGRARLPLGRKAVAGYWAGVSQEKVDLARQAYESGKRSAASLGGTLMRRSEPY